MPPEPTLMQRALWAAKSARQSRREADYVESMLGYDALEYPDARAHLLDVPCGNGRIALELAARGHRVTGVDLSEAAIQHAQRDAAARGLSGAVALQAGDMRDLPWENHFDGAYCLWESFGYFDDAGNRAFAAALARTLKPGARLLLDTHVLESLLPHLARRVWTELDGGLIVLEERTYDHLTGSMTRHWQVIDGAQVERTTLTIRVYSYRELVALLEAAGFTGCTGYTWMSIVPFVTGAPRLVLVATRA